MEVVIICSLMLSESGGAKFRGEERACCSSVLRRAEVSSRRMATHSEDLRLLCWNMRIRGVERSKEVYCRWSCDLRYSGGRWEGGCVGG